METFRGGWDRENSKETLKSFIICKNIPTLPKTEQSEKLKTLLLILIKVSDLRRLGLKSANIYH